MTLYIYQRGTFMRPFEEKHLREAFGGIVRQGGEFGSRRWKYLTPARPMGLWSRLDAKEADTVWFRPQTESITRLEWTRLSRYASKLAAAGVPEVNPIRHAPLIACKDQTFARWNEKGIPAPPWTYFDDEQDVRKAVAEGAVAYPLLLRVNNLNTGKGTVLVEHEGQLPRAVRFVQRAYRIQRSINLSTRKIAVELVDTVDRQNACNVSYRLHVYGDRVVSQYARVGDPKDWLAITNRFTNQLKEGFVRQNQRIATFVRKHGDKVVAAVQALGMHAQGVDMIMDQKGNPYFLEVQPNYFAGHPRRNKPPFYNPDYADLVHWLVSERETLERKMPEYYATWLDKDRHFELAAHSLRRCFP